METVGVLWKLGLNSPKKLEFGVSRVWLTRMFSSYQTKLHDVWLSSAIHKWKFQVSVLERFDSCWSCSLSCIHFTCIQIYTYGPLKCLSACQFFSMRWITFKFVSDWRTITSSSCPTIRCKADSVLFFVAHLRFFACRPISQRHCCLNLSINYQIMQVLLIFWKHLSAQCFIVEFDDIGQ